MLRALTRQLAASLDRQGTRWVLSTLLPVAGRFSRHGVRRLSYSEGGWTHHFNDIILCEPTPRLRCSHLESGGTERAWGFLYAPAEGDVVVDVGAGLGSESIYYSRKVGPSGRVVAVEAQPAVYNCLRRTIEMNGIRNVTPLNIAATAAEGLVYIGDDLDNHLGNSIDGRNGVAVPGGRLDEMPDISGLERINFLKMNIEGAERFAIEGMHRLLERIEIVCVSCHDFKYRATHNDFFRTKVFVEEFFDQRGFVRVPRDESAEELADQVNAFNPKLVDLRRASL